VPEAGTDHRFALKLLGGILAAWLIAMTLLLSAARLPPEGRGIVIAVFPPRATAVQAIGASAAAGAKVIAPSWFENVLVVADDTPGLVGRLEDQGALAVFRNMRFGGFSFAGCVGARLAQN
jgi:hypothetical protein